MTLNEYQERAAVTRLPYTHASGNGAGIIPGLAYTALGVASEAGEVANLVKKVYRDDAGHMSSDRQRAIMDELGDVLWYVAAIADDLGVDLEAVADWNLKKLSARHAGRAGG